MSIKNISLCLLLVFAYFQARADEPQFIENKGQWPSTVRFQIPLTHGKAYLTDSTATFLFINSHDVERQRGHQHQSHQEDNHSPKYPDGVAAHAFRMVFEGSNANHQAIGNDALEQYYNYYLGNDESKWASGVKSYKKAVQQNIYNGIDVVWENGQNGGLKYSWLLKPGANPADIKIRYEGSDRLFLQPDGSLKIITSEAEVTELAPVAFQGKRKVACSFVLTDSTITYRLGNYNPNQPLVIDPELVFASYSGSTADNWGNTATYDNNGHTYLGGIVFGTGFPATTGAFDATYNSFGSGQFDVAS